MDHRDAPVRPVDRGRAVAVPEVEGDAGLAHAEIDDAPVADDDEPGDARHAAVGEDAGQLLRPEAGADAGRHRNDGKPVGPYVLVTGWWGGREARRQDRKST